MSEKSPDAATASAPPAVPGCDPETVRDAQVGYHRMLLAFSLAVMAACLVLPAPDDRGRLCLPGTDTALPTLCMLKREYGIDCPGCGLTRCFLAISHARPALAWHYHPAGVLLFAATVAQIPYRLVQIRRLRRGRPLLSHWTLTVVPWLLVIAILGQWVLKMAGVLAT